MNDKEKRQLVLEKFELGLRAVLPQAVANRLAVREEVDASLRALKRTLVTWLLSNQVHESTHTHDVPATWWDSIKERWLRFLPVRHQTITTINKFIHVCPHLDYKEPDEERLHLQFLSPVGYVGKEEE